MVYHKLRLIIGCILIALIVSVNTFTVTVFVINLINGGVGDEASRKNTLAAPENAAGDTPAFSTPDEIILRNGENTVTLTPSDEDFSEILELNELSYTYVPTLEIQPEFTPGEIEAYCIDYVYKTPKPLSVRGYRSVTVTKITFVLTGIHHSKLHFTDGTSPIVLGTLSVVPELNVTVVGLLSEVVEN